MQYSPYYSLKSLNTMEITQKLNLVDPITERVMELIGEHETNDGPYFYIHDGEPAFSYQGEYLDDKLIIKTPDDLKTIVKAFVTLKMLQQGFVLVYTSSDNGLVAFEKTPEGWRPWSIENDDDWDEFGAFEPDHETNLPIFIGWD